MRRRQFISITATLAGSVTLYGCDMTGKKNIKNFGKTFDYLNDPELRAKQAGSAELVVKDAEFSAVDFQGMDWDNIRFVNCDFVGAYQIKPRSLKNSQFERCRFSGIFNLGELQRVIFKSCQLTDTTHLVGDVGSTDVVFDSCEQIGSDPNPNQWGSFGTYGEVEFIRCKAKLTNISGEIKHVIRDCDFEDVNCSISKDGGGSAVLIENTRLKGRFKIRPAVLLSLTLRDTTLEGTLDLTDAQVKGDVLIERVKGGAIKAGIKEGAQSFTLKDSQIMGDGQTICSIYAGAFKHVLVENVVFGNSEKEPAGIGGGYDIDDKKPQPVLTQSYMVRNVKAPWWRSAGLSAAHVVIEGSEFGRADLFEGKIGTLELNSTNFGRLDLRGTQVADFKVTGTTDLKKLGRDLQLDGSDLKRAK